jgi:hypothetical protein
LTDAEAAVEVGSSVIIKLHRNSSIGISRNCSRAVKMTLLALPEVEANIKVRVWDKVGATDLPLSAHRPFRPVVLPGMGHLLPMIRLGK